MLLVTCVQWWISYFEWLQNLVFAFCYNGFALVIACRGNLCTMLQVVFGLHNVNFGIFFNDRTVISWWSYRKVDFCVDLVVGR